MKNVVPGRRRTAAVVKPIQVNKLPPLSTLLLPKAAASTTLPLSAQQRDGARAATTVLTEYGFPYCPWLNLPAEIRYPRQQSTPPYGSVFHKCMRNLVAHQERGDLLFVVLDGMSLGARLRGGPHTSGWDDIDMDIVTRIPLPVLKEECKGVMLDGSPVSQILWPGANKQTLRAALQNTTSEEHGAYLKPLSLARACICEFEGVKILCPDKDDRQLLESYGASFWVPPPKGGFRRSSNQHWKQYLNPESGLINCWKWHQNTMAR